MKPILEVQNISKKYQIQHLVGGYLSLRERIANALKFQRNAAEDFWALKDVSFEVQPGESVGIIGRNGAGKSTLLKILSKITPPTTGTIISRGRIASLLEVGTGFHPELTGRENIFFNGSLLGMKRKEIERKFDEIVDFSGVEKFLDTPLKHYSSGMQLRLAFAVAAFLEPEILVIDEVLAVGDAEFQKKCLGKMEDVSKSGRTILFVSHNMPALVKLCNKAILIEKGALKRIGSANEVSKEYLSLENQEQIPQYENVVDKDLYFRKIYIKNEQDSICKSFEFTQAVIADISVISATNTKSITLTFGVLTKEGGVRVFFSEIDYAFSAGENHFNVTIPPQILVPGRYTLYLVMHIPNTIAFDEVNEICQFSVEETGSPFLKYGGRWDCGVVIVDCKWKTD